MSLRPEVTARPFLIYRMKRIKIDLRSAFEELARNKAGVNMEKTTAENLDLDYGALLPGAVADELMRQLEDGVEYYGGELTKVWSALPVPFINR